ncbi:distal tail protein Dit [Cytobacillus sp. FSL W7-1323]|uniref:distal tail protein Dit n=1 Tax=Cytobacillus sp. FSL W7-1323 TaxID=2921700 RepID=UPI00315894AB
MSFYMSFNGHVLPIRIYRVGGRGPIEQEVIGQEKVNGPGAYFIKRRLKPRRLPVDFTIISSGLSDMRSKIDMLNSMLYVKEPVPIVFSDEPDKTYYGILNGEHDWDEIVYRGRDTLPFVCLDPFKYGTERSYTIDHGTILNGGSVETCPTFEVVFTDSASEYVITHQETGGFIRVIWNFVAGDRLIIDTSKRKVIINNNLRMPAYDWMSRPFNLVPSSNSFAIAQSDFSTTKIKFTPKWS